MAADRISRLAGLERVGTIRQGNSAFTTQPMTGSTSSSHAHAPHQGYFDNAGGVSGKEKSTVGSASATSSVGARTTWADASDIHDADKMSEDQEDGISSAGLSDEGNASLVGFGEGASSTISGPTSTLTRMNSGGGGRTPSGFGSPSITKAQGYINSRDGRNANMTGQETAERIIRERLSQTGKFSAES